MTKSFAHIGHKIIAVVGIIVTLQTLVFLTAFVLAPRHGLLAARRRVRQARDLNWGTGPLRVDAHVLGRWRRHAPLDCGRPLRNPMS